MNMHNSQHDRDHHDYEHRGHDCRGGHWRRHWVAKIVGGVVVVAVIATCVGWIVTLLWNWLMPTLFGLAAITFWQALGLFLLGRILVGSMRGFNGRHHRHHRRMHERWERMSAEERESFSRGLKHQCGGWGQRRSEPRTPSEASGNPSP